MPVAAAVSLIQMGIGAANKSQAKSEAEQLANSRPKIGLNTDELDLAESELQQGLSARAERAYTTQMDKGLSNSLATILKGGGNINSVGDLYANADEGRQRLVMLNENTRLNQIQTLIAAQRNNVAEKQKQFEFNEWMPWADKAQANAQSRVAADAQFNSGLQGFGSAAMQFGQNQQEMKMFDKYLNSQNSNNYQPPNNSSGQFGNMPTQNAWRNYDPYAGRDFYQYSDNNSQYNNYG